MGKISELFAMQQTLGVNIKTLDDEIESLTKVYNERVSEIKSKKSILENELSHIQTQVAQQKDKVNTALNSLNIAFNNICQFHLDGEIIKVLSDGSVVDAYELQEDGKYAQSENIEVVPFLDKTKRIFYCKRIEVVYRELDNL